MQVDFSGGRSIFDKISEAIRGKEIGLLGIAYNTPKNEHAVIYLIIIIILINSE